MAEEQSTASKPASKPDSRPASRPASRPESRDQRPRGRPGGGGGGRRFFRRKKVDYFAVNKIDDINYKDVDVLKQFIGDRGKILPRRHTGLGAMHQRKLKIAIKRARNIALLPFAGASDSLRSPRVEVKPVEAKPVEAKPVEAKPVEAKPVEAKPVEAKPVEAKPVESKPVEAKPVATKADKPASAETKPAAESPDG